MSLFEQYESASSPKVTEVTTSLSKPEGAAKTVDSDVTKAEDSPKKRGRKPGSKATPKPTETPWDDPISIDTAQGNQSVPFPAVIPDNLLEVVEKFSKAYRVSQASVAVSLYFLTAAAMGKGLRSRDHWGQPFFPNVAIGMITDDAVRMPSMIRGLSHPLTGLVIEAQRIHEEKSPTLDSGEPYPMLDNLYGEAKRSQFAGHLEAHSGCGSILAIDGDHVLRNINREAAWFRRILLGDVVEDVRHAARVNILALLSPEATRHLRDKATAAARLFHMVNLDAEPVVTEEAAGFRVDDGVIVALTEHYERCLEVRVAHCETPLEVEFTDDAEGARSAYLCSAERQLGDATAIEAAKLAAIHHTMVNPDGGMLDSSSWQNGLALAEYFRAQTDQILEVSEENEAIVNARNLLHHAHSLGASFAQSAVYTTRKVNLKKKPDVEAALNILIDCGWLRQQAVERKAGRGRTPVRFEWHPNVVATWKAPDTVNGDATQ